jgi:hypothetical protein
VCVQVGGQHAVGGDQVGVVGGCIGLGARGEVPGLNAPATGAPTHRRCIEVSPCQPPSFEHGNDNRDRGFVDQAPFFKLGGPRSARQNHPLLTTQGSRSLARP